MRLSAPAGTSILFRVAVFVFIGTMSFGAALLPSCSYGRKPVTRFEGFALGTIYSISVKGDVPDGLERRVDSLFIAADRSMSVFNEGSLLARLNRNETDSLDAWIACCIGLARGVSELSGGRYDITILPLTEAYGFSRARSGEDVAGDAVEADSPPENVDSLLKYVGYNKIDVRGGRLVKQYPQTRIDLNSIAKGYVVDLMARMLEQEGIGEYLVNIGGEVFCRGTNANGKEWIVGIETPIEGNYIQGASVERRLAVSGVGVATSGNYRNFRMDASGRKFTHIIDPITGANTESRLLSASVVAETCALADALGTMFIALGLDDALSFVSEHEDIAVLLIYADEEGHMKSLASEEMKHYLLSSVQ